MQTKSIYEIEREYDFEIETVVSTIKKDKARLVLLQFPDGLKPYSTVIAQEVGAKTDAEIMIWLGTCFGACDVPLDAQRLGVDLIVQFGHSIWPYKKKEIKLV